MSIYNPIGNLASLSKNSIVNVIPYPSINNDTDILITPTTSNTIVRFDTIDNTNNTVTINIDVNSSNNNVGDSLILLFKTIGNTSNAININLNTDGFVYAQCGGINNLFDISPFDRFNMTFVYDGSVFIDTNDNC
jgi:hypothetical protein